MKEKLNTYTTAFAKGFAAPFDHDVGFMEDTSFSVQFARGLGQGVHIGLIVSGTIFTIASYGGAVVPVKWKPLWSKWFWNRSH